jgi:PAS domain S-box-containing protein
MNPHSEKSDEEILRNRIIGLGTRSHHKSYFPELKRRIAELERFRTLLNETGDAIFLVNATTHLCIDTNRAAGLLTGYSPEELLSTRIDTLFHPDYQAILTNPHPADSFRTDEHQTLQSEVEFVTASGIQIPVEVSIRRVVLAEESYYVLIARDITERKRVEAELFRYRSHLEEIVAERSEELTVANQELIQEVKSRIAAEEHLEEEKERLEITLRSIGDAVITTTIEGTITYLNKAAERMTGLSLYDKQEHRITDVISITQDKTLVNVQELILRAVGTGRMVSLDDVSSSFIHGRNRIISLIVSPIMQTSKTSGVVLVIRDSTERVRLTEEIQKHERLESLGVLAGGIAHDFNNVLTAILGNISLSLDLIGDDSPAAERIREAERATFRAKSLTQQLLTFSKGGAPIRESSHIEELITETAGFATSGSHVRVLYDFPQPLDLVEIDRGQISQVVQNLVINAQQAMPSGGQIVIHASNVVLSADEIPGLTAGRYVKISCTDEGQGISQDAIPHIFEPYFTTKETGNGLGLTSSMFILKKHGGTISVVSEPGIGTTFTLWLPASEQQTAVQSSPTGQTPKTHAAGTVLLMDDEEGILNVVSTLLKRAGWEVTCAHDGEEAISAYTSAFRQGHRFDAIIMDLVIPGGMGGKDAIAEIKKIDPDAFAIVSSGYSNDPVMADPQQYGFSRVLPKPYKIKDLLAQLQRSHTPM